MEILIGNRGELRGLWDRGCLGVFGNEGGFESKMCFFWP